MVGLRFALYKLRPTNASIFRADRGLTTLLRPRMSDTQPTVDPREMLRHVPFPFQDGRFPPQLAVLVQRTVADGEEPAREVIHSEDNSWLVGDRINDPNLPGAATIIHMHHLLRADPTLEALASLPLGHIAEREGPGRPWAIARHNWLDEP